MCIYSTGDFSSHINQVKGNRDTLIMRVKLKRDENGSVIIAENNYIPVYIYSEYHGKPFVSMPLQPSFNGGLTDLSNREAFIKRIKTEVGEAITAYEAASSQSE